MSFVEVLLANYRKAPEFLSPTALNDCFDMYKYVLKHENIVPGHVVLSGDSAGGEICMTNCIRLRKENPELQPAAALCYSPMVDFSEVDSDNKASYCILVTNFADRCIATFLSSVSDPEERRQASAGWGELERFYEQGMRFKAKAEAEGAKNVEFDDKATLKKDKATVDGEPHADTKAHVDTKMHTHTKTRAVTSPQQPRHATTARSIARPAARIRLFDTAGGPAHYSYLLYWGQLASPPALDQQLVPDHLGELFGGSPNSHSFRCMIPSD
ncbi:hypothetical protein PHYSODRAFT_327132 [Phytophthora sojae]|uniref:Alpha/beta hydrolase fold-3 domain-containing protein n=1 Tax=Phytophthora sojae (strain P6497) TaxID=1094619 RepID=G4YY48_PHYSP|nr:hypothetical protein PHYSODRAFT_327132 [Phytophthora sojae]EGZ26216.1 hypothetical protein PHYSODRAFT_327132 [Phytophthora sojae]|eukprot:XP_009521504.1 hypothetical protein PHYSODRAFT_327132 [Phytophthora sojae]